MIHYFGNQKIEETPSGNTWRIFISKAWWKNEVGIRKEIVDKACKKLNRRIEISCGQPEVKFTVPAWRVKLKCPIEKHVFKFPNSPMRLYMVPIPKEKLPKKEDI